MKNEKYSVPVLTDPSDICNGLVGLKDIRTLFYRRPGPIAEIAIEQTFGELSCKSCGSRAYVKDRPWVSYVDLPFGGTPTRLLWKKHRMVCRNDDCETKTWTMGDHRISALGCFLTTRAAKWVTKQVGGGRSVNEVAMELGCDWKVVNATVITYGEALLDADRKRLKETTALGLDETLFVRTGKYRTRHFCTTVADVSNNQLIDILPTRNYVDVARWLSDTPHHFRDNIAYGALDLSPTYAAVYSVVLPNATQVVDRFHLIRLCNQTLDNVRRRVQQQYFGHRGRKDDPLYRARKLLVMRSDRLDEQMSEKLEALLALGDEGAEVALAYRVKEAVCDFYEMDNYPGAQNYLAQIVDHIKKPSMPKELKRLGKTIERWFEKIMAYHLAKVTNGPTEGLNNLIKRVKRVGFGFTNFKNYRIRALLYAGKPNWRVLDSIVVT